MKRNKGTHKLDRDDLSAFYSDVLIGSGSGKRLVMRVYPAADTFTYIVTKDGSEERCATFDEAINAYNNDD